MMQNDVATCQQIDAELTHGCSADVPTGLAVMRNKYGHDTPAGHRVSNILEMLDAWTAKPADIAEQVAELSELTGAK